jgi:hypothetical protein
MAAYRLDLVTLRPDLDPEGLEGSACTLLIDVVDPNSEEEALGDDPDEVPESFRMDPPLALTVGRDVILAIATALMDSAMVCRVDVSRAAAGWRMPTYPQTRTELDTVLTELLEEVNDTYEKERIYPIDISLIPVADRQRTEKLMDEFRRSPYSFVLCRRILNSGTVQLWLSHDVIHISADCEGFARVTEIARKATEAWGGETRWITV